MSNLGKKRLPYSKTVVIEYKVQLADVLSRNIRLKGSVASPLLDANAFNNGDINVTADNPYVATDIHSVIVLSSFDQFKVAITDLDGNTSTLVTGLFVHQGAAARVAITPIGLVQVRLQYLWS